MAGTVYNRASAKNVTGRVSCFEYVNEDGPTDQHGVCCGQAAAATAVATLKGKKVAFSGLFSAPWNPDLGWAGAGSTPARVHSILTSYFRKQVYKCHGVTELKKYLKMKYPVVILVDNTAMGCGNNWLTMHWVCAYGYTKYNVFLSNLTYPGYSKDAEASSGGSNVCPWGALQNGWDSWLVKAAGMGACGYVVF
jgi:hypothetical protein